MEEIKNMAIDKETILTDVDALLKSVFTKSTFGELYNNGFKDGAEYILNILNKKECQIDFEIITKIVCEYYGFSLAELQTKSRCREIVFARHICSYFLRNHTKASLKKIGDLFNRHHTTVIHSITTINNFIDIEDVITLSDIEAIKNQIIIQ